MGLFKSIKNAVVNTYQDAKNEWTALTTADKVKIVLRGMTAFGLGWMSSNLVDTENGPVVSACTFVGAIGIAGAGTMLAGEATDIFVDSVMDSYNKGKVKGAIDDD